MTPVETAVVRFEEGYNCSQAVLSAFAEKLGMDHATAVKIASGFGGGMGRMGETCGAVSGAYMALGLKYGGVDTASKERTYQLVREFARRFLATRDSLRCRDLLGCDISTPEGLRHAREQGLFKSVCAKYVREAAEIVEDLLEDA